MNILYLIHNGSKVVVAPQPFTGSTVSSGHTVTFQVGMDGIVSYMKANEVEPVFNIPGEVEDSLYEDHFLIEEEYLDSGVEDADGNSLKTLIGKKAVNYKN